MQAIRAPARGARTDEILAVDRGEGAINRARTGRFDMKNKNVIISVLFMLMGVAAVFIYLSTTRQSSSENRDKFYNSDNAEFINIDDSLIGYYEISHLPMPEGEINALYIDQYDKIYIGSGKGLFIVDTAGERLKVVALEDMVRNVTVSENGDIYTASQKRISVLDSAGTKKWSFDVENERTYLTSLAVYNENLFAADAGVRTVWRFDTSGTLIGRVGDKDTAKGILGFVIPSAFFDLAIGHDGSLWAANTGHHTLQNFRPDGSLISSWGKSGAQTEAFCGCCNPVHFTLLGDGCFVTSEKGFSRVKVYNQAGEFLTVVAPPSAFKGPKAGLLLAADSHGTIYVADNYEKTIRRFKRKEN